MRTLSLLSLICLGFLGCGDEGPTGGQALVGVTVIDGLGNPPTPDQVVVIRDGRIADVAPVSGWQPPRGVQQIELPGRFVMPGLIDLHAHVTILPVDNNGAVAESMDRAASEKALSTLLGFGITAVRNPAAPTVDGIALRDAVAAGDVLGPRILTAGAALGQTRPKFGPFGATPDETSIRLEVQRQVELGVDFIKLYASLAPKQVAAAIDTAHAAGKKVVGHLLRTSWTEAAQMGIDAITHSAPWSASYLPPEAQEGYSGTLRERLDWLEEVDFDGQAIQEMIAVLAERKVVVDPTLIALHTKFWGDDPMHRQNPELHLAPAVSRDAWQRHTFVDDWTPEDFERARTLWPRILELTRKMHEGGVLLAAGSDLPSPWVIPGVSLHHELRLLHDAGIPALEVLKIATYNGAIGLGLESEIGSIEPGKVADLIVLATDPTQNLNGTRAISHLFFGGRYLEPAALLE